MTRTQQIMRTSLPALGLALALGLGGCVVRGSYAATATYDSDPDLVYVEPGVYVVAERAEPTFYVDGFYWMYGGGVWYRSSVVSGGWVVYRDPPVVVRGIHNPRRYSYYRAPRDHRTYQRDNRGGVRQRQRYDARDHRRNENVRVRSRRNENVPVRRNEDVGVRSRRNEDVRIRNDRQPRRERDGRHDRRSRD
jgi:hypothetical protein